MASKVPQILDPTCEKKAWSSRDHALNIIIRPCVLLCAITNGINTMTHRAPPLPSGTCMFPWVACLFAWATRGGSVYSPITDFNIDSNPITDPITDFDQCWRLTIPSSHWARPAPSRKHTVTMYVVCEGRARRARIEVCIT